MGLLDQLADKIYAGFKNKLHTGLIRQVSNATSGGLDQYGDPIDTGTTDTACQGFTDQYSDFFRMQAGIPETDLKVCLFASSMTGITPAKDDKVKLNDVWYQLRKVETDPATALFVCQAFQIEDQD